MTIRKGLALAVFVYLGVVILGGSVFALPFNDAKKIGASESPIYQYIVADMNRDGRKDIVSLESSFGGAATKTIIRIYFHNGDTPATYENFVVRNLNNVNSYSMACHDMDRDTDMDILFCVTTTGKFHALINLDGTGKNWDLWELSSFHPPGFNMTLADMDHDGDMDVVGDISHASQTGPHWLENKDGVSGTWGMVSIDIAMQYFQRVLPLDANNDSFTDLFIVRMQPYETKLYLRKLPSGYDVSNVMTYDDFQIIHFADVDGDADTDIVAKNSDGAIHWVRNSADGATWESVSIDSANTLDAGIFAADMDMDGDRDVLRSKSNTNNVVWYRNNKGDGSSWTSQIAGTVYNQVVFPSANDVDDDGDMDILFASNTTGGGVFWMENIRIHQTDVFTTPPQTIAVPLEDMRDIVAVDLNRDGLLDIAGAFFGNNSIQYALNEGAPNYSFGATKLALSSLTKASTLDAGLMDNDAMPDIVCAGEGGSVIYCLLNRMKPTPTTPFMGYVVDNLEGVLKVRLAHMDYNSFLDVLAVSQTSTGGVGGTTTGRLHVYMNSGVPDVAGNWTKILVDDTYNFFASPEGADINRDGKKDIVVAAQKRAAGTVPITYSYIIWYEGSGGKNPTFTSRVVASQITSNTPRALKPVDLDRDGDTDIVCGDFSHNGVVWYENTDGAGGSWTRRTIATGTTQVNRIDIEDMDHDGDWDILAVCPNEQKLFIFENKGGGVFQQRLIWDQYANPSAAVWADINRDAQPDILASFNSAVQSAWFKNRYGQYLINSIAVAPAFVMETQREALLRLDIRHLGRVGDSPVTPFITSVFPREESGKIMLGSDLLILVDKISIIRDANGNKKLDDADTMIYEANMSSFITDPNDRNTVQVMLSRDLQEQCRVEAEKEASFFLAARFKSGASSNPIHSFKLNATNNTDRVIDYESREMIVDLRGADEETGLITVIPYSVQAKGWMLY